MFNFNEIQVFLKNMHFKHERDVEKLCEKTIRIKNHVLIFLDSLEQIRDSRYL
jgi:hypothetical protein